MGESRKPPLRVQFASKIKLAFHDATVTSDAGLLAYRELDEALNLTPMASDVLSETRTGLNTQHRLQGLFRQSIYSRLAGYEDVNDAQRLCQDPAMRRVIGDRAKENLAASASEMGRFETQTLSTNENVGALMNLSGEWIDRAHRHRKLDKIILDMDSSVSETYGNQEGSAYNGHFGCTCYHPLFVFNQFGDLERAILRRGNHSSAKFWRQVLNPVVERYRQQNIQRFFRGDSAFAKPSLFRYLEAEDFQYVIRLKANAVLQKKITHLMTRPVGRPPHRPTVFYCRFLYQAQSWTKSRLVIARIAWHAGELFPRVGFIVTNMTETSKRIVRFYNGRGKAEQYIKAGKNALKWTKLSSRRFKNNQVRLQLFALAYNLGNFLRQMALPRSVRHWSLTTLREKLIKIGAKVIQHSTYVIFQLAEVAVPRRLFELILKRIGRLHPVLTPG